MTWTVTVGRALCRINERWSVARALYDVCKWKCYNYHTIQTGQLRSQCNFICSFVCAQNQSYTRTTAMTKHRGTKLYACNNNQKNWLVINNYFTPNFIIFLFTSNNFQVWSIERERAHRKKQRDTFLSSFLISLPMQIQRRSEEKRAKILRDRFQFTS